MAVRQIPNLTPVVFLSPTAQLEIVQDGVTYRTSASQIAELNKSSNIVIKNDITSIEQAFPLFSRRTTGIVQTVYASDPNYNYLPSEGRLSALRVDATEGIVLNNSVISMDYAIPTGDNATSCGPLTLSAVIDVPSGSEWAII